MRRLFIAVALAASALSLSACSSLGEVMTSGPSSVANETKLDEQTLLSAESLYLTANTLAQIAISSGAAPESKKDKIKALDVKAYSALLVLRKAYNAGNAKGFIAARAELAGILEQITALVRSS